MPATTGNQAQSQPSTGQGQGTQLPFDSINEPGTYVANWSGLLLRIPEDALKPGRSPTLAISAKEPLFVTKISNDPFIQVTKARILAANCDVAVNF